MFDYFGLLGQSISSIHAIMFLLTILLHIIFANGVAKDVGILNKRGLSTLIVPGYAWVLATLIGGILTLAVYWLIHHSNIAKQ
ncbi:MAG: hypothetical protein K0S29_1334 [Gammaproteobacteria bacterium]|jgi:hypothetical protein|nr:hypothetical protein [Gammaproteobacteria bacterium]